LRDGLAPGGFARGFRSDPADGIIFAGVISEVEAIVAGLRRRCAV
jgi:hypothetical protein